VTHATFDRLSLLKDADRIPDPNPNMESVKVPLSQQVIGPQASVPSCIKFIDIDHHSGCAPNVDVGHQPNILV
jgi:hypothetical protein